MDILTSELIDSLLQNGRIRTVTKHRLVGESTQECKISHRDRARDTLASGSSHDQQHENGNRRGKTSLKPRCTH